MITKRLFGSLALFLIIGPLCGCLIIHQSDTTGKGISVAPETFAQIKPGATTVAWVEATLGQPSSKTVSDSDVVWKYIYAEHTNSSGTIFLIFGGSSTNEKTETTFIEFKDGIVINKWRG